MSDLGFIHRFIPAPKGPPARILLLLHGTGSLRGNVLENGMPRFFRRLAEGVFDEEDVVRRANELADFIPAAAAKYEFDQATLTAVGYSNGANIAAAVFLLRPGVIKSAVLLRAMVPLTPAAGPYLAGARVMVCSGTRDVIIPIENAKRLTAMLREAGADVTLRLEDAGHQLVFDEIAAAKKWLQEPSRERNPV